MNVQDVHQRIHESRERKSDQVAALLAFVVGIHTFLWVEQSVIMVVFELALIWLSGMFFGVGMTFHSISEDLREATE